MSVYAVCTLLPQDVPKNSGTFRPISVTAPEGSIVNAQEPRACSNRNLIGHRIPDLVYGALADAIPDRVMAACYGSTSGVFLYFQADGEFRSVGGVNPGGWGATSDADGESVLCAHLSNVPSFEMEALEREAPVFVEKYGFREESAGAGEHRGGFGLDYRLRYRGQDGTVSFWGGRHRTEPFGLRGGRGGERAQYQVRTDDGEWETVGANEVVSVSDGDVISYLSAGGGGFGDPLRREPALVLQDWRDGLVSAETARETYGVRIDTETGTIDGVTDARARDDDSRDDTDEQ